jgi:hypothetical protein
MVPAVAVPGILHHARGQAPRCACSRSQRPRMNSSRNTSQVADDVTLCSWF